MLHCIEVPSAWACVSDFYRYLGVGMEKVMRIQQAAERAACSSLPGTDKLLRPALWLALQELINLGHQSWPHLGTCPDRHQQPVVYMGLHSRGCCCSVRPGCRVTYTPGEMKDPLRDFLDSHLRAPVGCYGPAPLHKQLGLGSQPSTSE